MPLRLITFLKWRHVLPQLMGCTYTSTSNWSIIFALHYGACLCDQSLPVAPAIRKRQVVSIDHWLEKRLCGLRHIYKMDILRFLKHLCSVSPPKDTNTRPRLQSKIKEQYYFYFKVVLVRIRWCIQSVTLTLPLIVHSSLLASYVYCVALQRGTKLVFLLQCNLGFKVTTNRCEWC